MAGSRLGMWQPKRKDGKNWKVSYSGTYNGKPFEQTRSFRIKADATQFIKTAKSTFKKAENAEIKFISIEQIF